MSSLHKDLIKSRCPLPMAPPSLNAASRRVKRDYTPSSWKEFFDTSQNVQVNGGCFKIYEKKSSNKEGEEVRPVIFCLHGGGYSGLSWACFACDISELIDCDVVSMDLRGHGETTTDNDEDLSTNTLAADVAAVYMKFYENVESKPPVILLGHSLGGALAVHVAERAVIEHIIALIVIDVVEGTALDSLQNMQAFLRSRPQTFRSIEYAVEWSLRSGQTRNLQAAKISMPAMLKRSSDGVAATLLIGQESDSGAQGEPQPNADPNAIPEDEEVETPSVPLPKIEGFNWRIDLSKTEVHWKDWFSGLSTKFLSCPQPKLLLLAGIDRLDKDLTIGQMQGKFQTQVLPKVGHAVHEDAPDRVAEAVASFLVRNKLVFKLSDFAPPSVCC